MKINLNNEQQIKNINCDVRTSSAEELMNCEAPPVKDISINDDSTNAARQHPFKLSETARVICENAAMTKIAMRMKE